MSTKVPIAFRLPTEQPVLNAIENRTIDLTPTITSVTVLRDGVQVTPPLFNPSKVDQLVNQLQIPTRIEIPRVVSQTVPPGTRVVKGSVIDVVLVPVSDIRFNLLDDLHPGFATKSISDVLPLFDDPAVAAIIAKAGNPASITDADKAVITAKLQPLGIAIDDTNTQTSAISAIQTIQQAAAFR